MVPQVTPRNLLAYWFQKGAEKTPGPCRAISEERNGGTDHSEEVAVTGGG